VTIQPLDLARGKNTTNQLNLFPVHDRSQRGLGERRPCRAK